MADLVAIRSRCLREESEDVISRRENRGFAFQKMLGHPCLYRCRRPFRSIEGLKRGFDFSSAMFKERWKGEPFAQSIERFVSCKAGSIRGDLEENAVRLAKI